MMFADQYVDYHMQLLVPNFLGKEKRWQPAIPWLIVFPTTTASGGRDSKRSKAKQRKAKQISHDILVVEHSMPAFSSSLIRSLCLQAIVRT